jgi:hypothetical protein
MARHVLRGEFPIFFWGQPYLGTLEVYSTVLVFLVLGATPLALKVAPLLWFSAFLAAHYRLARSTLDRQAAVLGTLAVGVSPAFLAVWSLKSRGGYMALLLLGTLSLLLASRMLDQGYRRRDAAMLGAILGLACWTHFLAVVYLVPILAVLILKDEKAFLRRTSAILGGGLVLGSLPVWIYNLRHDWVSLRPPGLSHTSFEDDLLGFLQIGLPMVIGARPNWNGADLVRGLGFCLGLVLCGGMLLLAYRWLWSASPSHLDGKRLLLLFVLCYPVLFSASGFAWFIEEPRYLIPLYSCLYPLLFSCVRGSKARFAICGFLLCLNVAGAVQTKHYQFNGYSDLESQQPLIAHLESQGLTRVIAPYWTAYRLTFEASERIIATPPEGDTVRYSHYLSQVRNSPEIAYVTLESRASKAWRKALPAGFCRITRIGKYEVYIPTKGP